MFASWQVTERPLDYPDDYNLSDGVHPTIINNMCAGSNNIQVAQPEGPAGNDIKLILVAGSTGYVGRQLVKALEISHYRVRCLARRPEALRSCVSDMTKVVQGDVLNLESLAMALEGVHTAFYLIHSMASEGDFAERDRRAAQNFATIARESDIKRIIYLVLCPINNV